MSLIKVNPRADWNSDRLQVMVYRDFQGLNMGNSWWDSHYEAEMVSVERICPNLHFLDLETEPSINNVYTNDAAVDGSRFQYNSLQKTTMTLHFWLQFTDYRDFIDKKHDIESFFSAKAGFDVATNYHPNIHARGYVNKIQIKPNGDHDAIFDVTMDNAYGMWFTNKTSLLEEHWDSQTVRDLRMPKSALQNGKPTWKLHPGTNKVFIPGDVVVQLSNPIVQCNIHLNGCSDGVSVINKTNNTRLVANNRHNIHAAPISGNYVWMNLNFGKVVKIDPKTKKITYTPSNMYSNSTDFWLNPGWNTIELQNAASGYIDTSFYFTTI